MVFLTGFLSLTWDIPLRATQKLEKHIHAITPDILTLFPVLVSIMI